MIRYRLDELGWYQFEWLCQSLLCNQYGVAIEAWGGRKDSGRDAYCEQPLYFPRKDNLQNGPFVFQAKFVENANAPGSKAFPRLRSALKAEMKDVRRRLDSGEWNCAPTVFCLLSNAMIVGNARAELSRIAKPVLPDTDFVCIGGQDLCNILDLCPKIRAVFPQILGLADLKSIISSVLNKAIMEKSALALEEAAEIAAVFVQTTPFNEALLRLEKNHFVMLTGPPEMGKTAIARIIGLSKFGDNWKCYEVISPEDVFNLLDQDISQIFIADDAFGSTEYRPEKAQKWADDLSRILRVINKTHWIIFTSRSAPLNEALNKMHRQGNAQEFPDPASVIVDASQLSRYEKARILFWHARSAKLQDLHKKIVVNYHNDVITNKHFTPLRIAHLVKDRLEYIANETGYDGRVRTKISSWSKTSTDSKACDHLLQEAIRRELEEPTRAMKQSFDNLPNSHKVFLISLLDCGSYPSQKDVYEAFNRHNMGTCTSPASIICQDLYGHFLKNGQGFMCDNYVEWVHPTWRDLVIQTLYESDVLRNNFLKNAGIHGITLAISTAGGEGGERNIPLLVCPNDWDTLKNNILCFCRVHAISDVETILSSLNNLMMTLKRSTNLSNDVAVYMQTLLGHILPECHVILSNNSIVIPLTVLSLYIELSLFVRPLPACPVLHTTWDAHWSNAKRALSGQDTEESDLKIIGDWLALISLIEANEPRFLRQINWPDQYLDFVSEFLGMDLENDCNKAILSDNDDYEVEIVRLNCLRDIIESITSYFPATVFRASELSEKVQQKVELLQEELSQQYSEPEQDDDYIFPNYPEKEGFDIATFFNELL